MGSHSYLVNLNSCAGVPAAARQYMQCSDLMELGDTLVDNYQAQGVTNFKNSYGRGNTQVNNLIGTRGSQQNFGLQELGDTLVDNYQAMGETNFRNTYGKGNTQVNNLIGVQGSVQNFGLQNLMIGPAWTYDAAIPKPLGTKDMGSYSTAVYTPQQLDAAKQVLGEVAQGSNLFDYETKFNGN